MKIFDPYSMRLREVRRHSLKLDIDGLHYHITCGLIRPADGNKSNLLAILNDCYRYHNIKEACHILAECIFVEKGTTVDKIADYIYTNYTVDEYEFE